MYVREVIDNTQREGGCWCWGYLAAVREADRELVVASCDLLERLVLITPLTTSCVYSVSIST